MQPGQDEHASKGASPRHRAQWLLALGAAIGLVVAAGSIVAPSAGPGALPDDAVAVVNGVVIRRDDYLRLLAGFQSDSKGPVDEAARRHILDRMIDEELLVQRGLALGLAKIDRRVRADLTSSLIGSIASTAEDREPDEGELEAFYDAQSQFFTRPGRMRVRQVFFRVPTGSDEDAIHARAQAAREALLSGRPLDEVRDEYGDEEISPLPDTLLPALKLREYVGPTALRAAEALAVGEVGEPVRSGVGMHVLVMADAIPALTPPFDEIRDQVENEWRRRSGDRALRAYLDQLRDEGDVEVLAGFDARTRPER